MTSPETRSPGIRVVGTAGHVDHGKSTLITALTGTNPDRLREERERGMTIDLGFAWLELPDGTAIGIVDVPGHRDFIRNMLAGVGSIDAVILVIAADEGVMPQTREHVAILELLGIERGVIALTKRDLVDDEWAALARDDVRAALQSTPLADAPLVEVSALTRRGLDDLVAEIQRTLGAAPPRRDVGRPRLPIDRAFTMVGFGTVVTGTLLDGSLRVGDEIEIAPQGLRGRIRGLQTHGRTLETAQPGSRVAVNISGVEKEALARGMVLSRPGTVPATSVLSSRLDILKDASVPLEHDDVVKVHLRTAEETARVSVLERDAIEAGGTGWVQLRLATPVPAVVGDRLVIRRASPSETLGGGTVADVAPVRVRGRKAAAADLERRAARAPAERILAWLDVPRAIEEATQLANSEGADGDAAIADLVAQGDVVRLGDALVAQQAYEGFATRIEAACAEAHARTPLRAGVPRAEARSASGLSARSFNALVEALGREGRLVERGSSLALAGHEARLSQDDAARWSRARAAMAKEPLGPPSVKVLEADYGIGLEIVIALADRGELVRVGADSVFLPEAVATFANTVIDELERRGTVTVPVIRDLLGSSRKYVLPLLQFLDENGITRRTGDDRTLLGSASDARRRATLAIHGTTLLKE